MMQAVLWALVGDAGCSGFTTVAGRPKVSQQICLKVQKLLISPARFNEWDHCKQIVLATLVTCDDFPGNGRCL